MKRLLIIVGGICGCVLFITVYRIIVFRQSSESGMNEANINTSIHKGMSVVKMNTSIHKGMSVVKMNTLLHKGTGKYKLTAPNGTKNNTFAWSQYGQDQYIDQFLKQKRNGFFVEIGGYDGESFSNTLFLEMKRGWSGLLVEANPYTYDLMVKKDRHCFMMNACISNTVDEMTFIVGGFLTSVKKITPERHKKRIDNNAKLYAKDDAWRHAKEDVTVKCHSLQSLLKTIGQTRIDYFSLDVEGAEMIILNSIDWKALDIDVFTIETDQHRQEILEFMKSHGYKWIRTLLGDDIFRKIK